MTLGEGGENEADPDGYITIKTHKTGKYGRWLVDIDNVNKALAEKWPYEQNYTR